MGWKGGPWRGGGGEVGNGEGLAGVQAGAGGPGRHGLGWASVSQPASGSMPALGLSPRLQAQGQPGVGRSPCGPPQPSGDVTPTLPLLSSGEDHRSWQTHARTHAHTHTRTHAHTHSPAALFPVFERQSCLELCGVGTLPASGAQIPLSVVEMAKAQGVPRRWGQWEGRCRPTQQRPGRWLHCYKTDQIGRASCRERVSSPV